MPHWLAEAIVHLVEVWAGGFLVICGLIITGDFRHWWYHRFDDAAYLPSVMFFLFYLIAVGIWRYV